VRKLGRAQRNVDSLRYLSFSTFCILSDSCLLESLCRIPCSCFHTSGTSAASKRARFPHCGRCHLPSRFCRRSRGNCRPSAGEDAAPLEKPSQLGDPNDGPTEKNRAIPVWPEDKGVLRHCSCASGHRHISSAPTQSHRDSRKTLAIFVNQSPLFLSLDSDALLISSVWRCMTALHWASMPMLVPNQIRGRTRSLCWHSNPVMRSVRFDSRPLLFWRYNLLSEVAVRQSCGQVLRFVRLSERRPTAHC
jgi:hypothetical protein